MPEQNMMETLFGNNLINWLLLAALIIWGWTKYMPGIFEARRQRLQAALDDAAKSKADAQKFLADQKVRIDNLHGEQANILQTARQDADNMKKQGEEQTKKDIADLERKLEQQIATHRQMVITELRSQAAIAAVRLAEASLPGALTNNVKKGLQERFVSQLDQIGAKK